MGLMGQDSVTLNYQAVWLKICHLVKRDLETKLWRVSINLSFCFFLSRTCLILLDQSFLRYVLTLFDQQEKNDDKKKLKSSSVMMNMVDVSLVFFGPLKMQLVNQRSLERIKKSGKWP